MPGIGFVSVYFIAFGWKRFYSYLSYIVKGWKTNKFYEVNQFVQILRFSVVFFAMTIFVETIGCQVTKFSVVISFCFAFMKGANSNFRGNIGFLQLWNASQLFISVRCGIDSKSLNLWLYCNIRTQISERGISSVSYLYVYTMCGDHEKEVYIVKCSFEKEFFTLNRTNIHTQASRWNRSCHAHCWIRIISNGTIIPNVREAFGLPLETMKDSNISKSPVVHIDVAHIAIAHNTYFRVLAHQRAKHAD